MFHYLHSFNEISSMFLFVQINVSVCVYLCNVFQLVNQISDFYKTRCKCYVTLINLWEVVVNALHLVKTIGQTPKFVQLDFH
jgi:hypothetical protein